MIRLPEKSSRVAALAVSGRGSKKRAVGAGIFLSLVAMFGCDNVSTVVGSFQTEGAGGVPLATGGVASSGGDTSVGGQGGDPPGALPLFGLEFEAEDGLLNDGFRTSSAGVDSSVTYITAEVSAVAADSPGNARATYEFEIVRQASYVIYARIHAPGVSTNRFWFRVDEGAWTLWRVSTGEEWFWDSLHENFNYGTAIEFELTPGVHRLQIANAVVGAELDSFSIAEVGQSGPENLDLNCNPPHSIQLDGQCVRSCGSYLTVSCGLDACAGKQEVLAYDCAICCLL